MPVVVTSDPLESHVLVDGEDRVTLAPARGGLVTRFSLGGDELLYLDEATLRDPSKNVRGGIPLLFPFAGRLPGDRYTIDGATYELGQHGIARRCAWAVRDSGPDARIVLGLEDDDRTRAVYPFRFSAELCFVLEEGWLSVELTVRNTGERAMPVAPGWHPYFRVDDARKHEARVITDATRFRDNRTGLVHRLEGTLALDRAEVDAHFEDHRDAEVVLVRPDGEPPVSLQFPFGTLVVWTLPGRDFVCVEPWESPAGAFPAACRVISPGATAAIAWSVGRLHDEVPGAHAE